MSKRFSLLLLLLSASGSLYGAEMSHEEQIVRNAYAKLSYAVDLNSALTAGPTVTADELKRQVELKSLRFQLSNFKVGNVSDVSQMRYVNLAGEQPVGDSEIISTSLGSVRHTEKGQPGTVMHTVVARWSKMPSFPPDGNPTVGENVAEIEKAFKVSPLTRYATFTVTVAFDGRSLTYPSIFFFSSSGEVIPEDMTVGFGGGPLTYLATHSIFPKLTRLPPGAMHDLLESTQRTDAACVSGDACCDLAVLRCSISSADFGRVQ